MAQPTNTFDSYDAVGIREDLTDAIHNVDPHETPLFTALGTVSATNKLHEWQTDGLRASGVNAHIEGDDTVATARTPTERLGNYTQIFKDAVVIPDSDTAWDKAGRAGEMAYQIMKTGKEIRLDVEKALFDNQARVAGNSTTARRLAGLGAWVHTNTVTGGTSPADPTGDGTDARTDGGGAGVAFSQARFNNAMQQKWDSGTKDGTVYLSSHQMNLAVENFTGNNNQRNNTDSGKVENYIVAYQTQWGELDFVMSRECRSRDVWILDESMWKIAYARRFKQTALAKTGDNTKRQVVAELTLEACNEKASAGVFDNTTA